MKGWPKGKERPFRPLSAEHRAALSAVAQKRGCQVAGWNKGGTSWSKGIRFSDEHKAAIARANKIAYQSPERRKAISIRVSGSNAHNWKGGIATENRRLRFTSAYKTWRKHVFERDDYTCQRCKRRGGILNAHHDLSFSQYPDLRFEILNGETLCEPCHHLTPSYGGRNISNLSKLL